MDWQVARAEQLPFQWNRPQAPIPVLGVVFVKKSTLGALNTTL
jgi:hypothetical protein